MLGSLGGWECYAKITEKIIILSLLQNNEIKTSCINRIETKFLDQEIPSQGLTTMLHCCINIYITYAIISERLMCFSSFQMQWYMLKLYCVQSKNLWKKSLALLLECFLSNVKKLGKKQCQWRPFKAGNIFLQSLSQIFHRFFWDTLYFWTNFPGLFYVVIFQPQPCCQNKLC